MVEKTAFLALLVLVLSLFFSIAAGTHEKHSPKAHQEEPREIKPFLKEAEVLARINENYLRNIKPIFQRSCFDCHTLETNHPWYYSLPGAKQLIDRDIREGKRHIDMSNNFPFKGHGSPIEDLEAIRKVIMKNTMPPFRYRIMNWKAWLTEEEKLKIIRWVEESRP